MSILSVDNISPIGSGTSVTVNSAATLVLNNANSTGVVTATSFVGNLTGTASANAVLTGSTNNTLVTVTGANAITGEANLKFDGTNLDIDSDSGHLRIGDDQDLDLYHNGSNGYLKNSTGQQLYRSGTHTFENAAGSTEYLRITSGGAIQNYYNTSLPVTDSRPILQLGYGVIGDDSSGYNAVTCNAYPVNGNSTWHYIGSSSLGASRYHIGFGDHKWFTASAGTRGNDITWSERLRITSGGKVNIGGQYTQTVHSLSANSSNGSCVIIGNTSGTGSGSHDAQIVASHGSDFDNLKLTGHAVKVFTNVPSGLAETMTIDRNGYVTKPKTPAFHVSRQGGNVSANNYVTFDHADYNNGSHYNTSDGKFTAPVTGIYFFSAWNYTGSTSAFYLRINGTTFGEYTWDDTGGCGTWVCPMTSGQYAQIYTRYTWRGTADYHNAFCGYLIG